MIAQDIIDIERSKIRILFAKMLELRISFKTESSTEEFNFYPFS